MVRDLDIYFGKGKALKKLMALAVAFVLTGCGSVPINDTKPVPATSKSETRVAVRLTSEEIRVIQNKIKSRLKDPGSAMFPNIVAASEGNSTTVLAVCGFVNAKNSFGGYTGNQIFYTLAIRRGDGLEIMDAFTSIGDSVAYEMSKRCRV